MKTSQNYHYMIFFSLDTNERNNETCNLFREEKSVSRKEQIATTSKSVLWNKANLYSLITFEEFCTNMVGMLVCVYQ